MSASMSGVPGEPHNSGENVANGEGAPATSRGAALRATHGAGAGAASFGAHAADVPPSRGVVAKAALPLRCRELSPSASSDSGAFPVAPAAHGGDVLTYRERYGADPLDFSANSNPLGISPAARIAAADALRVADRYPDPLCRELRAALGERMGVSAAHVICGNGAADLIWRLALALRPRRALLCAPTFSEYEAALRATSGPGLAGGTVQGAPGPCRIVRHELHRREGFALTERILADIAPGTDVVFLCVPNNPTGLVPPRALLEAVLARCEEVGALLVVDECFNGFLPDPDAASLRSLVEAHPRLLVLGAFTKLYGMAGLRLGWALCSDEALLAAIGAAGQAWPVSNVAQAAGVAALSDDDFLAKTRALIAQERPRLARGLAEVGCTVYPGQANYLFFESPVPDLCERVATRSILIRDCANYPGLRLGDCRVAVRTPIENDTLLRAVRAALAEAHATPTGLAAQGPHVVPASSAVPLPPHTADIHIASASAPFAASSAGSTCDAASAPGAALASSHDGLAPTSTPREASHADR